MGKIKPDASYLPELLNLREKVMGVYEKVGGDASFQKWAELNPTVFYTQFLSKMIDKKDDVPTGRIEIVWGEVEEAKLIANRGSTE